MEEYLESESIIYPFGMREDQAVYLWNTYATKAKKLLKSWDEDFCPLGHTQGNRSNPFVRKPGYAKSRKMKGKRSTPSDLLAVEVRVDLELALARGELREMMTCYFQLVKLIGRPPD